MKVTGPIAHHCLGRVDDNPVSGLPQQRLRGTGHATAGGPGLKRPICRDGRSPEANGTAPLLQLHKRLPGARPRRQQGRRQNAEYADSFHNQLIDITDETDGTTTVVVTDPSGVYLAVNKEQAGCMVATGCGT